MKAWPSAPARVVMHVDMDAFFAAVEENLLPVLRGKPVIVGGPRGARGVASTANYVARAYGVHSATSLKKAAQLCPDAHFISSSFGAYADYSRRIVAILERYSPRVEPASVDEAYLDITGMERHFESPWALALALKKAIRDEMDLTCSVGIAPNKLLAKMASSQNKPDGLFALEAEGVEEWLAPQPVRNLWGVGGKTEEALKRLGIRRIADLQALSQKALIRRFGKWGHVLHDLARGVDNGSVVPQEERPLEKSISHEHTFGVDTDDPVLWHATLLALSDRVARRARQAGLAAKTVTLKFRTSDFVTRTRGHSLERPTVSENTVFGMACRLLEECKPDGRFVRLLGVALSNFTPMEAQGELLASPSETKHSEVTRTVDKIRDRFGGDAIGRLGARYS
jgi:DNA polymerase-4